MAANTGTNKRIPVKWIRDRAKGAYNKDSKCFICESTKDLELHHTHGLTNLYDKWLVDTGYTIETDEEIIALRDEFIKTFHKEIYEDVFTLCLSHHRALHSVYGKSPLLNTANKQSVWIQKQKDKFNGVKDTATSNTSFSGLANSTRREIKSSTSGNSEKLRFSSFY